MYEYAINEERSFMQIMRVFMYDDEITKAFMYSTLNL
jgi:hypothetical protein